MSDPKVGDVYVHKTRRTAVKVLALKDSNANVRIEPGTVETWVTFASLVEDYERQESVQEAAERGFRPLMEGGR